MKTQQDKVIGWGKDYFAGVTKEQFLKDHQHYADDGVDLEKVWNENQPAKVEKKAKAAEEK